MSSLITHIVIHGGLRCYHVPPHKGKKNPRNQVLFKLSLVLEIIVFNCRWQVAGTDSAPPSPPTPPARVGVCLWYVSSSTIRFCDLLWRRRACDCEEAASAVMKCCGWRWRPGSHSPNVPSLVQTTHSTGHYQGHQPALAEHRGMLFLSPPSPLLYQHHHLLPLLTPACRVDQ